MGAVFFVLFAQGEVQDWVKPYMFDDNEKKDLTLAIEVDNEPPPFASVDGLPGKEGENQALVNGHETSKL